MLPFRRPQGAPPGNRPSPCRDQQGVVRAFSPCLFCTDKNGTGQATCLECTFVVGTIKRVHLTRKPRCHVDMRELKGLEIAARCRVEFKNGTWLVPSQSGQGKYRVMLSAEGDRCECEDFSLTGKPCKHVHA